MVKNKNILERLKTAIKDGITKNKTVILILLGIPVAITVFYLQFNASKDFTANISNSNQANIENSEIPDTETNKVSDYILNVIPKILNPDQGDTSYETQAGDTLFVPTEYSTIASAISAASSGDTIHVLASYSQNERINLTKSGLTFQGDSGATMQGFLIQASDTTITGFRITTLDSDLQDGTGIWGESGSNVTIENNEFYYNTWGGIHTEADASDPDKTSDWTIRSNHFVRNAMFGVELMGKDHVFENNEIQDTIQFHPCSGSTAGWLDADGIRFHGDGHVYRDNYVHDLNYGPAGYDTVSCSLANLQNYNYDFVGDSHTDCFQTYKSGTDRLGGTNVLIENNICDLPPVPEWTGDGVGAKALQASGDSHHITIINNLFITDFGSYFEGDGGVTPHHIYYYHNTMVGSNDPNSTGLRFLDNAASSYVKNNIFAWQDNGLGHVWNPNGAVVQDYNCVWRRDGWESPGAHDVNENPLFADVNGGDYTLQSNSPCKDAGATNLGITTDILGVTRPWDGGYDMGAYEYYEEDVPTDPPSNADIINGAGYKYELH